MSEINKTSSHDSALEKGEEMLILAIKMIKPDITDNEARNVIVNVGNNIQLRRLENGEMKL